MSYARVIVNPAAGAGKTARKWPQIMEHLISIGFRFEHDLTESPGHAIELAREAAEKGYEQVVSVGGDGTINEIVNGLYHAGSIGEVTLGIIEMGTGGDYVRTAGVPRTYEAACKCLVNTGKRVVDVGVIEYKKNSRMETRLFVNFAGFGFDAEIARRTTQQFKSMGSKSSYLAGLLTTLLFYDNKEISLVVDGEVIEEKICTVVMNNGRYGGGGMLTAPEADLCDGLLDVLIIGDLSKADLLRSLPRIYKGTHLTHPKVTMKKAKEIEIRSALPLPLQADGELIGEVPARFRILPVALNIAV
ncbi:diacylglycerol/lipid kinase family protein [Chloroflexota bacterium]